LSVPSRLVYRDCQELLKRVKRRVNDWKNKSLSFAGRAQLIRSVLSSMHIYWASMFILPSSLMYDLEQVIRGFLWCQGDMKKWKAKVAWEVVKWIHAYKLKGRSFWEVPLRGNLSWGWRKILQIHQLVRPFFWSKIGTGVSTCAWTDMWNMHSPLSQVISSRDIHRAGFSMGLKVADIISHGSWTWPNEWQVKYSCLSNINVPNLSATSDSIVVRDLLHKEVNFSVSAIWGCIRTQNNKVSWYNVVWFPQQIPRYATHLWLVMKRKLKTQDLIRTWDLINPNVNLMSPFCNTTSNSHEHLFFACSFSHRVWEVVKDFTGVSNIPSDLDAITNYIISMDSCGSLKGISCRLVFWLYATLCGKNVSSEFSRR
nr:hypothetical protein [Tanacetum cinerariifolium]